MDASEGFLRALRRRNRRPNTEKSYRYELRQFGSFIADRGVNDLVQLGATDIEAWQDDMLVRRLTPSSQIVRISALRGFLKWASVHDMPLSHPTLWLRIESPRVPEQLPRPIPTRDLALIIQALDLEEPVDIWRLRTRALFWVLFSSGARITEALSLKRGSTDKDGSLVIQKGGRPHILVIGDRAIAAIIDYDQRRTDEGPSMFASLFPGHAGEPLKKYEAQLCWNRLARELGIPRFKSHQIRHSCATTMRRNGADVVLIARHLGHRTLAMVQKYTLIEVEDRQAAVATIERTFPTGVKLHPLNDASPSRPRVA